jgi:hypothetical protein
LLAPTRSAGVSPAILRFIDCANLTAASHLSTATEPKRQFAPEVRLPPTNRSAILTPQCGVTASFATLRQNLRDPPSRKSIPQVHA